MTARNGTIAALENASLVVSTPCCARLPSWSDALASSQQSNEGAKLDEGENVSPPGPDS